MKILKLALCITGFLCTLSFTSCNSTHPVKTYSLNESLLNYSKEKLKKSDQDAAKALGNIVASAEEALKAGSFTVVSKKKLPPSGDRHDYMSMVPYWWPNP